MKTWKTKTGQVILIHQMTTDHIKNAMSMIERKVIEDNKNNQSSAYMKEAIYEYCHSEKPIWQDLNEELKLRLMGR